MWSLRLPRLCAILMSLVLLAACGAPADRAPSSSAGGEPIALPEPAGTLPADVIVFDSDRTGNYELFSMRDDGSGQRQLTSDPDLDSWWPRPSPDRQHILFYRTPKGVHDRDFSQTSLWVMNADGSSLLELRPSGTDGWDLQGHAEWSPDGAQLVMFGGAQSNPQIHVTDATGRDARQVTDRGGTNIDPSWSPDGAVIVFIGCPAAICFERDYEVYSVPATGGDVHRLTDDSRRDHDPYFSPHGTLIAWLVETDPEADVWNLFLMSADGSEQRSVTNDRHINSKPAWSADGSWIYFHRLERGTDAGWRIFAIRPDGNDMHPLTDGAAGNDEYPAN